MFAFRVLFFGVVVFLVFLCRVGCRVLWVIGGEGKMGC